MNKLQKLSQSVLANEKTIKSFLNSFHKFLKIIEEEYMVDERLEEKKQTSNYYFVEDKVIEMLSKDFSIITDQMKPMRWSVEAREFYRKHMEWSIRKIQEELEKWYEQEWKKKFLNFNFERQNHLFLLEKIDQRNYSCGQLRISVEGKAHVKKVSIKLENGLILDSFEMNAPTIANIENEILSYSGYFKRFSNLMNWSFYEQLDTAQKRALMKRYRIVREYYHDKNSYSWKLSRLKWYYYKKGESPR